jgi:enoyl-CoA hydratase / long-chain 3-hydroxyacyl-CoA dehydrogenase
MTTMAAQETPHSMKTDTSENGESRAAVRLGRRGDVAILTFDVPGEKMNTLSRESTMALQRALTEVESDATIRAVVLISGKEDNFIAGADVKMLQSCKTATEVAQLSQEMHKELNRLERSKKPVVAAIHGACLGGGLEVALACHYRICTDHPKTVLALPEVMLGLLPGAGGTQRLPQLVGLQDALDMMLTGKNIRPQRAKKMGLVDVVTVPFGLEDTAVQAASELANGTRKRRERERRPQEVALEDTSPGRAVVFHQARTLVMDKTLGNYPAPLAILDVIETGMSKGFERGLEEESRRFGELAMTPEARNLMRLFFAQSALKKNRFGRPREDAKTIGVLGAGLMGAGIGLVSVLKDKRVLLKDMSLDGVGRGKKTIYSELNKRTKRRAITPFERDRLMSSVLGQTDYKGFERADLVIEAVFEDLDLKHRVIREVEEHISEDCVFASNTSALPISKIAEGSKRPENVVGMHYFSPVHKMPLLEVIVTEKTSREASALAVQVGIQQGKTVIVVKDGPGFYSSRILAPYMDEAALLALEGIDLHEFDRLMKAFGFPVGPITLLDEVGIDVAAHVAKDMQPFFEPRFGPRDRGPLEAMVKEGFLGRKAGKGFFLYDTKKKKGPDLEAVVKGLYDKVRGRAGGKPINPGAVAILQQHGHKSGRFDDAEVQQRMTMRMVNEAVLCLEEGILENPVDGDVGAVFGLGFPPFLGGPFRYADSLGASRVVSIMERLAQTYGKRFEPAKLLVEHAKSGTTFHTD